ncbi:hypothetical protein YC2023_004774 [Brassica napus]
MHSFRISPNPGTKSVKENATKQPAFANPETVFVRKQCCNVKSKTTLGNGYLGSRIDEERSEMRYLGTSAWVSQIVVPPSSRGYGTEADLPCVTARVRRSGPKALDDPKSSTRPQTAPRGATGSGHDGALTLSGAPFQGTWARSVAEDASPDYNLNIEDVRFSSWALPGLWVIKSFLTGTSDYMTRIKFTTACQDAPDVLSSDFGQPRAVTHGRSASVPYPREDGGTTICDTQADVPSARRLGAQLAFKDSMVHGILQFTPSIAFRYVLHRCESRDIRCRESYAYDPTKTEVLAKDERITTESAGTVRNRPTESDVSSFSGRSVSRWTSRDVAYGEPPTSPRSEHFTGSFNRGVLKATSADPWSASFMVETRTLFVFHKSKNFTSDYEIRMPPTACFEHSNFFKVTAPEARPGQLRPERIADRRDKPTGAHRRRTGRPIPRQTSSSLVSISDTDLELSHLHLTQTQALSSPYLELSHLHLLDLSHLHLISRPRALSSLMQHELSLLL